MKVSKEDQFLLFYENDKLLQPGAELPACDLQALRLFYGRGGLLVLMTHAIPQRAKKLNRVFQTGLPMLCCGGAQLYDPLTDRVIQSRCMQRQAAQTELERICEKYPRVAVTAVLQNGDTYLLQDAGWKDKLVAAAGTLFYAPADEIPDGWVCAELLGEKEDIAVCMEDLKNSPQGVNWSLGLVGQNKLQMRAPDAKYSALYMPLLEERVDLINKKVIALPTSQDSACMIKRASCSIAPADASAEIRVKCTETSLLGSEEGALGALLYTLSG